MTLGRRDALVVTCVVVATVADVATNEGVDGPRALNVLLFAGCALLLLLRRTRPAAAMLTVGAVYVTASATFMDVTELASTLFILAVLAYSGARHAGDREFAYLVAASVATVLGVDIAGNLLNPSDIGYPLFMLGMTMLVGRLQRNRELVARQLAERTERLAHEREVQAAVSAADERRRIARELHDVVAHTLSVLVVQAGGARRTLHRDAERADAALATVEETGRAALEELRRLLGFVGEPAAGRAPQPGLRDLDTLARRARDAGLEVTLETGGEPGELGPGAGLAAYRVVQESLTNVLKHAGPVPVTVAVRWAPGEVEVEVRDAGRGGPPARGEPGHGIAGMRERVALHGGELEAGPATGGGWRVVARLPLVRERAAAAGGAR